MENPIVKCKCGCGEVFKKFDKWHRERKYFIGHGHRKFISMCKKPSENNPTIQCKCGCGTSLLKFDNTGRPREYCIGHNKTPINIEIAFWKNVKKTDSCWIWNGSKQAAGYGELGYRGKRYAAHRVSWEIHNGEIKNSLHVLHKCDNPSCTNPKHLFLGTHADNMHDAQNKKRIRHCPITGRFVSLTT